MAADRWNTKAHINSHTVGLHSSIGLMGRKPSHESSVLHSSIALLQERFRKLERVKEKREGRELLRLFTQAQGLCPKPSSSASFEQPKWFFHPDLVQPSMHLPAPAPFRLKPHGGDCTKFEDFETSLAMGLSPNKPTINCLNEHEDVDASLHL